MPRKLSGIWYNTDMKIDERCLPYAEEMKTCGYCSEGEFEWGGVFAMNPKRKFLSDAEYAELVAAIKGAVISFAVN